MQIWNWIKEQTIITKLNFVVLILSIGFLLFGIIADRKDIVGYIYIVLTSLAIYFSMMLMIYWIKIKSEEDAETKRDGYRSSYLSDIIAFILQIIACLFF